MASAWVRAAMAVLVRPWLWSTAVRQVWILRRRGWWRQAPFLPVPHGDYLRFRMLTAYGDATQPPAPGDVVTYLHWCRAWPRVAATTG